MAFAKKAPDFDTSVRFQCYDQLLSLCPQMIKEKLPPASWSFIQQVPVRQFHQLGYLEELKQYYRQY